MTISQNLTLELIRYEIFNTTFPQELLEEITDEVLEEVFAISNEYDVLYITGTALSKLGVLSGESKSAFFNEQLACVYRNESILHELSNISELFETENIDFLPLKGSVIRDYYPKSEMRSSCDIDILIHPDNIEIASALLIDKLNYTPYSECSHDVSFYSPTEVELELHFSLYEGESVQNHLLDKVWQYATPCEGITHKHELDKAFFMFYHIVHMAKHVRSGGCGIRPFLDLVILEEKFGYDKDAFMKLISQAGLETFTKKVFDVAHMWFGTMEPDETADLMAEYVFGAGAYGSIENQVARNRSKGKSKFKSILSRIFISRKELEVMYPTVKAHPVLTPVFEIVRWGRIIFKDKAQKQMAIVKQTATLDQNKINSVSKLMDNLGL